MLRLTIACAAVLALLGTAGCGEKAQTAGQGATKKTDGKPWEGAEGGAYSVGGWKSGDKAAWEAQLKARTERGQNEYTRTAAKPQ
jgi:hypothetical protein